MRLLPLLIALCTLAPFHSQAAKAPKGLYALESTDIDGQKVPLSQYSGKVALVVNVASQCGFTPQYQGLESLYQKYKDRGFVILGFPSNDFGAQEPGSNSEIKTFCEKNYRITFPLFNKDKVTGAEKQPVYQFLTNFTTKGKKEEVQWNFEKFLVNQKGDVVGRFNSRVSPTDDSLQKQIETLLAPAPKAPKKS